MSAKEPDPLVLPCRACGGETERTMVLMEPAGMLKGVVIEAYVCQTAGCGRKVVTVWEPIGGLSEDQKTLVEREVMRTGSFFPGDFVRGRAPGRPW